jgi:nicotinic acid mononucleotide adenylyltransferase
MLIKIALNCYTFKLYVQIYVVLRRGVSTFDVQLYKQDKNNNAWWWQKLVYLQISSASFLTLFKSSFMVAVKSINM